MAGRTFALEAKIGPFVKLLEGKAFLVTGVTNRWSIATGIAAALYAHGAKLALTYQGERVKGEVEKLAAKLGGAAVFECDVTSDETLRALAAGVGSIDGFVHSIAFVNKEDLVGKVYDTSRSGFARALDISSYSLIALTAALRDNLKPGASIMALTYYGATAIVPNYNIAGIAKAALESIVRYLAFDLGDRGILSVGSVIVDHRRGALRRRRLSRDGDVSRSPRGRWLNVR
jgi:enoyl-[acyl-carrier protein] reductase I